MELREFFLHELKAAIRSGNSVKASLVREIIKNIKLHQIEIKDYATNQGVIEILEKLQEDINEQSYYLQSYLNNAQ